MSRRGGPVCAVYSRPRPGALYPVAALILLAPLLSGGCGRGDGSDLSPADAGRWLEAACGVRFREAPQVLESTVVRSRSGPATPASAIVTVVLPDAEADEAVRALARNRSLHRRGQSDTRYSYESYPGARPEAECELDRSQRVLYFRYVP